MRDDRGRFHPRNDLNDLTGREWLAFTRTWFVADSKRYWRNKRTELHPARFPEEMVEPFVRFFTKQGMWVLDPFAGSGATLVACQEAERCSVGIEVNPRYAATARERVLTLATQPAVVIESDVRRVAEPDFWAPALSAGCPVVEGLPQLDFILTSPPYWNMLRTSRGHVFSSQRERASKGLDTHYSDNPADLGNLTDYDTFVETLGLVFDTLAPLLRPNRYLVVVAQNLRAPGGEVKTLAWDLARRIGRTYQFQGERIWCQNVKRLGIWGYPRIFVPNYHHHYCLIFRKPAVG
ncbi:MAG: hypothetical protein HYU66_10160 [Armatimonadetes bacterium]|nr:hypothetical protein [Armatimonadota bacterium]